MYTNIKSLCLLNAYRYLQCCHVFCRSMLFWSQLYMIGFSASQLFYTYFLLIFPLLNSDFWMFCFWSEPILQRTFDLWRFFMMQDVSSIYDLFDPKLREISAKHHFMTCTTHSVCHKVCKDLRLVLVKFGKKYINRLAEQYGNIQTEFIFLRPEIK